MKKEITITYTQNQEGWYMCSTNYENKIVETKYYKIKHYSKKMLYKEIEKIKNKK